MPSPKNKGSKGASSRLKLVAVGGQQVSSQPQKAERTKPKPSKTSEFHDEIAAMSDEQLVFYRSHVQTDLWVIESELRRREEERDLEHKRARRVIVDVEQRIAPGQLLLSEAGTPMAFVYKGTAWDMTATAAKRRGVAHLSERTVCYAHGKPVAFEELSEDGLAAFADDRTETLLYMTGSDDELPF